MRLRPSEWLLIIYFAYVAALCFFFPERPYLGYKPLYTLAIAGLLIVVIAAAGRSPHSIFNKIRDWTPLAFTLVAFREMDWFTPMRYTLQQEHIWIQQDQWVLTRMGLARAVEAFGPVVPGYLELCYLLVYATGAFCVLTLWLIHKRPAVKRWMVIYLAGTLLSYALFPFFPSLPPRVVVHPALVATWFRRCNLWLLDAATIHSAVFPSAHVSSTFSAAWGLFAVLPQKRRFGWGMFFYACSVSLATIYGRYHYVADVVAGFGISLVTAAVAYALRERDPVVAAKNQTVSKIRSFR